MSVVVIVFIHKCNTEKHPDRIFMTLRMLVKQPPVIEINKEELLEEVRSIMTP